MAEQTSAYMSGNILGALSGVKSIFNKYLAIYGIVQASYIVNLTDGKDDPTSLKVLGLAVDAKSFSMILGMLFALFIVVLAARIKLLNTTLETYQGVFDKQSDSEMITLHPWGMSPFHQSRQWPYFGSFLAIGLIHVFVLSLTHYFPWEIKHCFLSFPRAGVGSLCLVAFIVGVLSFRRIHHEIAAIRARLMYPDARADGTGDSSESCRPEATQA